jgi:hypothetical protein
VEVLLSGNVAFQLEKGGLTLLPSLFGFAEYNAATTQFIFRTINDLMRQADSVLNQIPFHDAQDLPKTQITTRAGEVVETETMLCQMEFSVALSDSVAGNLEGFATSMHAAAESGLQSLMPQIFAAIGQVCAATGNTVNAEGQGLTHEVFLQMLESLDIRFDEQGNHNLTWVMTPALFEELSKLPPPTDEQNKAMEQVLERKKQEFNANKRRRQLVTRKEDSN